MIDKNNWQKLHSALNTIHSIYGSEIINEPDRLKDLLSELTTDADKELKAFCSVLCDQDVVQYFSKNLDVTIDNLTAHIEANAGLSNDWAEQIAISIIILFGKGTSEEQNDSDDKNGTKTNYSSQNEQIISVQKKKEQKEIEYEQQLLKGGYIFLSTEMWNEADGVFDSVLRYKKSSLAYVGKMMAKYHIKSEKEIPTSDCDFESDTNWKKALKYATSSYKETLMCYVKAHKTHLNKKGLSKSKTSPNPQTKPTTEEKNNSKPNEKLRSFLLCLASVLPFAILFMIDETRFKENFPPVVLPCFINFIFTVLLCRKYSKNSKLIRGSLMFVMGSFVIGQLFAWFDIRDLVENSYDKDSFEILSMDQDIVDKTVLLALVVFVITIFRLSRSSLSKKISISFIICVMTFALGIPLIYFDIGFSPAAPLVILVALLAVKAYYDMIKRFVKNKPKAKIPEAILTAIGFICACFTVYYLTWYSSDQVWGIYYLIISFMLLYGSAVAV